MKALQCKFFLDGLTEEQQRHFREFAHHLYYIGMEDGAKRRNIQPTEELQARILVVQTDLYLSGAGEALDPPYIEPFVPPPLSET